MLKKNNFFSLSAIKKKRPTDFELAKYSKKTAKAHIQGEDQIPHIIYNMYDPRNFNPNLSIAGEDDENDTNKSNKITGGCQ